MPELVALDVVDEPARWRDVGFEVDSDGVCQVGSVALRLTSDGDRRGLVGWSFAGLVGTGTDIDAIPTGGGAPAEGAPPSHANGASILDHVVVSTPDLERTVAALEVRGIPALRRRDTEAAGRPMRQVFHRPGEAIIELVGPRAPTGAGPPRFFGLAFTVDDLAAAASLLGDHLGDVKDAVQPGRRIATVRSSAGLAVPVALMSP